MDAAHITLILHPGQFASGYIMVTAHSDPDSVVVSVARDMPPRADDDYENPVVFVRLQFPQGLVADASVMSDGVKLELEASCLDVLVSQLAAAIATPRHAGLIPAGDPPIERELHLVE
jgi:hypothetical protein